MTPDQILRLIDIASASAAVKPQAFGRRVGGCGDFYDRLVAGADLTTRRAAAVVGRLSELWPDGADWPADIPRPGAEAGDIERVARRPVLWRRAGDEWPASRLTLGDGHRPARGHYTLEVNAVDGALRLALRTTPASRNNYYIAARRDIIDHFFAALDAGRIGAARK